MVKKLKQSWRRFKTGSIGWRFQQQFRYRQQAGHGPLEKALFIGGGSLLMVAGVVFLFIPGPGLLVFLLGGVLVAQQSLLAARILDWMEVHARQLIAWSFGLWRSFSPALKILLVVLALVVIGMAGLGAAKLLAANAHFSTTAWLTRER